MTVLKINKWIAAFLGDRLNLRIKFNEPMYLEDMSDKNPRWQQKINEEAHQYS